MASAAALSERFTRVTLLERDAWPENGAARPGTPQANHPHVLLQGGLSALCSLFPGLQTDLESAGAVRVGICADLREEVPGIGALPQRDFGFETYSMSRPLLEKLVRHRLSERSNVAFRNRSRATDFSISDGRIDGVVLGPSNRHERLAAHLVVDASGAGAWTSKLLPKLGVDQPTSRIQANFSYATAMFDKSDRALGWKMLAVRPNASGRGALATEIEGGRMLVTLAGVLQDRPPSDPAAFKEFAAGLWSLSPSRAIQGMGLVGPIHRFRLPESVWYHYEKATRFPKGLVVLGDSWCRFNPLYGMGMTISALEALLLRDLLHKHSGEPAFMDGLATAFFEAAEPLVSAAWMATAVPDLGFPHATGDRPADLAARLAFGQAILHAAVGNADVHRRMMEVRHLLKPPEALHNLDVPFPAEAPA